MCAYFLAMKNELFNADNLEKARYLRKNMTPWERKLWYLFLKDYPYHFYKQRPISNYIVDFYCPQAKLAIELDGSGHYTNQQKNYDDNRTKELYSLNIQVLRFCNLDIDRNFTGVCERIDDTVQQSIHNTPSKGEPINGT